ncbi:MAG: hypothetical protein COZ89_01270 [Candidatus Nealsonbacteria bacterium CG_4_8_14_3_um_filter_37_23]|nr:MAG: hypothetical protein COZ89_01270 [Candidatus Nealsonbacteria bacterium CG_4_8_14_3_um_filter_37_23]
MPRDFSDDFILWVINLPRSKLYFTTGIISYLSYETTQPFLLNFFLMGLCQSNLEISYLRSRMGQFFGEKFQYYGIHHRFWQE